MEFTDGRARNTSFLVRRQPIAKPGPSAVDRKEAALQKMSPELYNLPFYRGSVDLSYDSDTLGPGAPWWEKCQEQELPSSWSPYGKLCSYPSLLLGGEGTPRPKKLNVRKSSLGRVGFFH